MQEKVQVLIIGGGAVGTSIAYHLAKKGCKEVALCEAYEFASGATAFAAGHVILYTLNETISRLTKYSSDLYRHLEVDTGMSPGYHGCGNLRLATNPRRLDEFVRYLEIAESTGVAARLIRAEEISALWPLLNTDGILAGLYNPSDGHIAPADLTQSLAAAARQKGAILYRNCEVTGLSQRADGTWIVATSRGTITATHVVSASGNHSQRIASMVGLTAQCVPVRHQYFVTEPIPELVQRRRAGLPEMPVMRDPEQVFYCRQEADSLLVGAYDGRGDACFVRNPPAGPAEPFPDELEKLLPYLESAIKRVPALGTAGVRRVINYAMPYTPDDLPITGPALGRKNLWFAEGNPFGITLAGGIGWQVAEWILEGAPSIDMSCCDSRRFGEWATREWSARKVEEAYEHTYLLPKPEEELPAGRELRTSPIHDLLVARGAQFGVVAGWERPTWFSPAGLKDEASFYKPNWHDTVRAECRAAITGVAISDISHCAIIRASGTGAAQLLSFVLEANPPQCGSYEDGYLVAANRGIEAEVTIGREAEDRFLVTASAALEGRVFDVLLKAGSNFGDARIDNFTGREGALLLLGPSARAHLQNATTAKLNDDNFPNGAFKQITIGYAPALVARCDPFGQEGYRVYVRGDMLRHVFLALEKGATLVGARALESLRLESAAPSWPTELNTETPYLVPHEAENRPRLVHLQIEGLKTVPHGIEPIRDARRRIVGHTTSATWGHLRDRALAFALIEPWEGELQVRVMNQWYRALPTQQIVGRQINLERRGT